MKEIFKNMLEAIVSPYRDFPWKFLLNWILDSLSIACLSLTLPIASTITMILVFSLSGRWFPVWDFLVIYFENLWKFHVVFLGLSFIFVLFYGE